MHYKKSFALSAEIRARCVSLVLQEENAKDVADGKRPWLALGIWESSVKGRWPDFPDVSKQLQNVVSHIDRNVRVFYVCGTDHAVNTGIQRGFDPFGLVVVQRKATNRAGIEAASPIQEKDGSVYVAEQSDDALSTVSSTRVRSRMVNDESVLDLVPAAVAEYLAAAWMR